VTAFAYLLGYRPHDMVALAGVGPVIEDVPVHPASARNRGTGMKRTAAQQ
jgi:hypothetical protein